MTGNISKADKLFAGCWASSGYSVQGCAQLEQKLRQCMDAPVCPNCGNSTKHALTVPPAQSESEEEQHQLPSLENVPEYHWTSQAELALDFRTAAVYQ
jgi:hypothetical protein